MNSKKLSLQDKNSKRQDKNPKRVQRRKKKESVPGTLLLPPRRGIPSKEEAVHFNFQEVYSDPGSYENVARLANVLESRSTCSNIVLNFEKCQWFEVFPLAQLLSVLISKTDQKPQLHIVGPSIDILSFFHGYVSTLKQRLEDQSLTPEARSEIETKLYRHTVAYPQQRALAGAFLVGWGVFDALDQYYTGGCRWYAGREKPVTLNELRDLYLFGYGSTSATVAEGSDRIWPFTVISRGEQRETIERVNGEELIAGALRKHAACDVIADGTAPNVFFFEPFENVFEHAFLENHDSDSTLVAMRVTGWMFNQDRTLTAKAEWLLRKLPDWLGDYIHSINERSYVAFMEICITDCGQGIPGSIKANFLKDDGYLRKANLNVTQLDALDSAAFAWQAIKYAFEPRSTRRLNQPAGRRGLSWLKEKMNNVGGLVQIMSNSANYVLADHGRGLTEIDASLPSGHVNTNSSQAGVHGTFVRIIFPLKDSIEKAPDRRPRWERSRPPLTLFSKRSEVKLLPFTIPRAFTGFPKTREWTDYFNDIISALGEYPNHLAVVDLGHQNVTRAALESMLKAFANAPAMHGRTLVINCTRHVACRLDTVSSVARLQKRGLLLPLFEADLRLYWVGAETLIEVALLRWFRTGERPTTVDLEEIAEKNAGLFSIENDIPYDISFGIEDVEEVVRGSLGKQLEESLNHRGAIQKGRFVLPLSPKTISTYVEPHQIFSDPDLSKKLCAHLAILLRWRHGWKAQKRQSNVKVLTATRIGRDIAARMPDAFRRTNFVYFDYHLVQPDKPGLLKHVAKSKIVIVVDVVSTGSQVEELIKICEDANCTVLGIVSFIDFSPDTGAPVREFETRSQKRIEHKTFWRSPQTITDPQPGDTLVDKETLSISPITESLSDGERQETSLLSKSRGLRFLEDAGVIHYGHYVLFGKHFEFVPNFGRLLMTVSPQRDEILRITEQAILGEQPGQYPTAIVLYPDFSDIHMIQGVIDRRPRIRNLIREGKMRIVEARRGFLARGRRYWLTEGEVKDLIDWANRTFPDGYGVQLLDGGASSGESMLALLELARQLQPREVGAFVIVNRMPQSTSQHHAEIERFVWAKSRFSCALYLNVPVYSRDNCPVCAERSDLLRGARHAKEDWLKKRLELRLEEIKIKTALHPQDQLEGLLASKADISAFSWEDSSFIPGPQQTVVSRSLSARTAINDGVPITTILEEISAIPSNPQNDLFWQLTAREIGRRVDLQLSQRSESEVRDAFVKVVAGRLKERRWRALQAMRQMRSEALLPVLSSLTKAVLREVNDEDMITEFLILLRHVFEYRHLSVPVAFQEESKVEEELDDAAARAQLGSPRRKAIERINFEWGRGPKPRFDLVEVTRRLENIVRSKRRPEHQLLFELSEYIGDERLDVDERVRAALDNAVRAASLATNFVTLLDETGRLFDTEFVESSGNAHDNARDLRRWVLSHMIGIEPRKPRTLRDKMEPLRDYFNALQSELKRQIIDPAEQIDASWEQFKNNPPPNLSDVFLDLEFEYLLLPPSLIVIDSGLFSEVIRSVFQNLKHAVENLALRKIARAKITLEEEDDRGSPKVVFRIKCFTGGSKPDVRGMRDWSLSRLHRNVEIYGVEHVIVDTSEDPKVKWHEIWSFAKL